VRSPPTHPLVPYTTLFRSEEFADVPAGLGQFVVGEARARFQDADLVSLLHEAQRGDAATEPGPDDEHVEVGFSLGHQLSSIGGRDRKSTRLNSAHVKISYA